MKEYSAGGIITKVEDGDIKVLLVEHLNGTFVFPKGHVEKGETFEEAAKREISEEVGLKNIIIGKKLGIIKRGPIKQEKKPAKDIIMFKVEVKKYFHFQNTQESYGWFKIDEVICNLRYEEDKLFFQNIKSFLKNNL